MVTDECFPVRVKRNQGRPRLEDDDAYTLEDVEDDDDSTFVVQRIKYDFQALLRKRGNSLPKNISSCLKRAPPILFGSRGQGFNELSSDYDVVFEVEGPVSGRTSYNIF